MWVGVCVCTLAHAHLQRTCLRAFVNEFVECVTMHPNVLHNNYSFVILAIVVQGLTIILLDCIIDLKWLTIFWVLDSCKAHAFALSTTILCMT